MKKTARIIKTLLLLSTILLISCLQQPAEAPDQKSLVIYPPPPAKTRIQYLTSFSNSADFEGEQSALNKFLAGEKQAIPIVKPYGVSVYESKIYICDTGRKGLVILDTEDQSFKVFIPGGKGQLQLPINCDIDHDGNIYIADGNRRQVVIFNNELEYIGELGLLNDSKPTDVKADSNRIWVTASDNHSLEVFTREGLERIRSFPNASSADKEYLYQPVNISLSEDNIYISDMGSCSVKVFGKDMNFIKSFGSPGKGLGQFTRPKGISSDKEGNIYVVDAAFENVQIFNRDGDLLLYFGGTYTGPGGMWLPAGITIDYGNREYFGKYVDPGFELEYLIYVSNQYGPDKISVYGFVGLTE